jgi:acyl carrier protein
MDEYIKVIIEILKEINPYEDIEVDTDLAGEELLSSLNLMYLITELEERYDFTIPEDKIKPEYFKTVREIAIMIAGLKSGN